MSAKKKTISALQECSYIPDGSRDVVFRIDEVDIPVAATPSSCDHEKSVCRQCARTWREMHLFAERLPWERRSP